MNFFLLLKNEFVKAISFFYNPLNYLIRENFNFYIKILLFI